MYIKNETVGTLKLINETQTSDTFELKLNDYLRPAVPYMIVHVNDHVLPIISPHTVKSALVLSLNMDC